MSGQDQALHRGPAAAAQHAGPSTRLLPPLPRQVHLIKRRLSTLAPGMDIFLDVDNLQEFGSLADEVAASDVVLLFLSRGYFASKACAIEYEAAVRLGKPLILVHEANENKGGLPLQQARRDCPEAIRDEIFGTSRPVVSWQRSDAFQQVALKRIVAEVLVACGCDLPRSDLRVARRSSDDATATPLASLRSTPHAARRSTPHDAAAEATAASRSAASPSAAPSAASGPARIEEEEVESGALGGRGGVVVIGTLLGVSSAGAGSGADSRADAGSVTASGIVDHRSLGASSAGAGRRPLPAPKETRPAPGSGGGASRWTRGLWHSSRASGEEAAAGGRLGGGKGGRGGISGISLGSDALYLHTEARLAARLQGGRLVLAFSRHNPGAREIALEVASLVAGCRAAEWPLAGPLDGRVVPLLLLDATTFGGDCGEDLADDVRQWCAQVAASREPPQEESSAVALRPSFSSSLGGSSRRSGGGRAASPKRRNSLSRRPSLSRLPSLSCARGPVEPPLLLHAALAEETRGCPVRRGIPRAAHQLKIAVIGGRLPLRGGDAAHADRPRARVPLHADRAAVVRAARLQKGGAGRALAGARPAKPRRLSRDKAAGRLQLRCPAPQTAYSYRS
uniref:TIR domain-containing protein n=1 Tax=Emiliania huxleyi TaxID=2903 RepID=A0A7S3T2Z1_EMIHU